MSVHTEVEIDAAPSVVRETFLDFAALPKYHTSHVKSIKRQPDVDPESPIQPGEKLDCAISDMTFSTIVAKNSPEQFSWDGTVGAKFLMNGAHRFEFLPVEGAPNKARFVQAEDFTGILSGLFLMYFPESKTREMFQAFNEDLKKYVESGSGRE